MKYAQRVFPRLMQFVVEGENTQIGQFTLNFENYVDQSLHTGCFKNMHWIKQLF